MDIPATARALVAEHDEFCAGHYDPEVPYCSCAPVNHRLCAGCETQARKIESALRAAQAYGEVKALREAAEELSGNDGVRNYLVGEGTDGEIADWLRDRASRLAEGK